MTVDQIAAILVGAISLGTALFSLVLSRSDRMEPESDEALLLDIRRRIESLANAETSKEIERSDLQKTLEEARWRLRADVNELVQQIRVGLREAPASESPASTSQIPARTQPQDSTPPLGVRELSHSLGAPLVQIYSAAELIRDLNADGDGSEEIDSWVDRIVAGVNLCQAFLSAYRNIREIVRRDPELPQDLTSAANQLVRFYARPDSPTIELLLDGDIDESGYSGVLILILLAPLIENAIESLEPPGKVSVGLEARADQLVLEVRNRFNGTVSGAQALAPGFTTKLEHDGIGLPTVKAIARSAGGDLVVQTDENEFTSTITLPTRKAEA